MESALKLAVVGLAVSALLAPCSAQSTCDGTTPLTPISTIQGSFLQSELGNQVVRVQGVVTIINSSNQFQIQSLDSDVDDKDETSEGITIFHGARTINRVSVPTLPASYPTRTVGDIVSVCGKVLEFQPGGSQPKDGQTLTEIAWTDGYFEKTGTSPLPAPIVIGSGPGGKGRTPPALIYDSKAGSPRTNVAVCTSKQCALDVKKRALDFWESLESMLITIEEPLVVAGLSFGDVYVVPNGGSLSGKDLNDRCGVTISGTSNANADFNGEIVKILDVETDVNGVTCATPASCVTIGDRLAPATGVLLYDFGNYAIKLIEKTSKVSRLGPKNQECAAAVEPATTLSVSPGDLTLATYNILNFPGPKGRFGDDVKESPPADEKIAIDVVQRLKSPAIIALQEVQDNNGDSSASCLSTVVDGDQTGQTLINAIKGKNGPTYTYIEIDPKNGCDVGGIPGGNIRPAFLYDSARVTLAPSTLNRAGTNSEVTKPVLVGGTVQFTLNPGLVSLAPAFDESRKSLAAHFVFTPPGGGPAQNIYAISNHFSSKGGSDTLYGKFQPPTNGGEDQRTGQAQAIRAFVDSILALDSSAAVVVAGDLNEFTDFPALQALSKGGVLTDLLTKLPAEEQYTYNFNGNSQALDHIYVTKSLSKSEVDVIHSNSGIGFGFYTSDHDPVLAKLSLSKARKARRAMA